MQFRFEIVLIFVVPLSTAIIFGVIADRLGAKAMTGFAAMGGLSLGLYFLSVALATFIVR